MLAGPLTYEEAKRLVENVFRTKSGVVFHGIDGFEDETTYVQTEILDTRSKEEVLQALWRLYQIGCRLFDITYDYKQSP